MLKCGGALLLVLDDLWTPHQLTTCLGGDTRLPPGSQLLLTSRRRDVVAKHNPMTLELLSAGAATDLLAWHACGDTRLPADLSRAARQAVGMCNGLPLAIKVLGGMLFRVEPTDIVWQV